jgi:O-antigen/teichoic acid export membrane protein
LAYFRNVRDLTKKVDDEKRESAIEIAELKREAAALRSLVDRVQSATNTVVVFGVYLIGVTLLGFAVATISNQIVNLPHDLSPTRIALVAGLLIFYAATSIAGVVAVAMSGRRSVREGSKRSNNS